MKEIAKYIEDSILFYFNLAKNNYKNLSSFAIVTDESFDTFLIAINTDKFFFKLENGEICEDDYWNTAEWIEESLDEKYFNSNIEYVNTFLEENHIDDIAFFDICLKALQKINDNKDICMFVHITDQGFNKNLYEIVKELNGENVAESYKNYYLD